uniref:Uncharacterized protein n=1 Tax=Sinocyclocheilus rhinocerous TaxID=307959 RepID=A0A673H0J6_9TELE
MGSLKRQTGFLRESLMCITVLHRYSHLSDASLLIYSKSVPNNFIINNMSSLVVALFVSLVWQRLKKVLFQSDPIRAQTHERPTKHFGKTFHEQ